MANKISKNPEIIFPENTSFIISELMEKYGLKETPEQVMKKIQKGEEPLGTILARAIKKTTEKKMGTEELSSLLEKTLNLPSKKAQQLARDIKIEIIGLTERSEKKIALDSEVRKKEAPLKRDIYREPIE